MSLCAASGAKTPSKANWCASCARARLEFFAFAGSTTLTTFVSSSAITTQSSADSRGSGGRTRTNTLSASPPEAVDDIATLWAPGDRGSW